MAAHRYWRLASLATFAGPGSSLALSEVQLFAVGVRVDASATLTSTIAPDSGSLANLKDGDTATGAIWGAASLRGAPLLQWDLGPAGAADVDGVTLGAGNDPSLSLQFAALWFSDDATAWTRLAICTCALPAPLRKIAMAVGWLPSDARVLSQVSFVGANNSTTFADEVLGNVWNPTGGAAIKTDQALWGLSSGYFNGLDASLAKPADARLNFSNSALDNWTVEVFFRPGATANSFGTLVSNGYATFLQGARYIMLVGTGINAGKITFGGEQASGDFANPLLMSTSVIAPGAWTRVKVMRSGTFTGMWVNNVLEASLTGGTAGRGSLWGTNGTRIGNNLWDGANGFFTGHIAQVRFENFADTENAALPQLVRHPVPAIANVRTSPAVKASSAASVPMTYGTTKTRRLHRGRRDYLSGVLGDGVGRVRGSTLDYALPASKPYPCRVRLIRESDGLQCREQWSAADGSYDFQYIDELQSYTVLAYYAEHGKQAVAADGITLASGKLELMQ